MKTHKESIFRKSKLDPEFDFPDIRPSETVLFGEIGYLKIFGKFNNEVAESFRGLIIEGKDILLSESGKRILRYMLGDKVQDITTTEKRVANRFLPPRKKTKNEID